MAEEKSTPFLDNFFEFLPEDMQREIIDRCYKRPDPKYRCGDMVVFVPVASYLAPSRETVTHAEPAGTYIDTERPNDASGVYCIMMNPIWKHYQWTWEYLIRELKSDNSGRFSTEFIGNIRENENHYLLDCAFILNEHQMLPYNSETSITI